MRLRLRAIRYNIKSLHRCCKPSAAADADCRMTRIWGAHAPSRVRFGALAETIFCSSIVSYSDESRWNFLLSRLISNADSRRRFGGDSVSTTSLQVGQKEVAAARSTRLRPPLHPLHCSRGN